MPLVLSKRGPVSSEHVCLSLSLSASLAVRPRPLGRASACATLGGTCCLHLGSLSPGWGGVVLCGLFGAKPFVELAMGSCRGWLHRSSA